MIFNLSDLEKKLALYNYEMLVTKPETENDEDNELARKGSFPFYSAKVLQSEFRDNNPSCTDAGSGSILLVENKNKVLTNSDLLRNFEDKIAGNGNPFFFIMVGNTKGRSYDKNGEKCWSYDTIRPIKVPAWGAKFCSNCPKNSMKEGKLECGMYAKLFGILLGSNKIYPICLSLYGTAHGEMCGKKGHLTQLFDGIKLSSKVIVFDTVLKKNEKIKKNWKALAYLGSINTPDHLIEIADQVKGIYQLYKLQYTIKPNEQQLTSEDTSESSDVPF